MNSSYMTYEIDTVVPGGVRVWLASFLHPTHAEMYAQWLLQHSQFHKEGHDKVMLWECLHTKNSDGEKIKVEKSSKVY